MDAAKRARTGTDAGRLEPGELDVGPVRRRFWLARAPEPESPLLIVLHGLGTTGTFMARLTDLARRAPAAGVTAVFPEGWEEAWDPGRRLPGREQVDDPGFLIALAGHLADRGIARADRVLLAGISNGALCAEHIARHGLLPVRGVALVSGATTKATRTAAPRPAQRAAVLCIAGTGDRAMPYFGGPMGGHGLVGLMLARRARRRGETGDARVAVAAETVARDWAAVNGVTGPVAEELPTADGDLPVTRLTWSAPERPPVVVYRVEGGGHTWPGSPHLLPSGLVGRTARLDATGLLLDMVTCVR